jgi:hypothetical protein
LAIAQCTHCTLVTGEKSHTLMILSNWDENKYLLGYPERCHNHCFNFNCFRLHYYFWGRLPFEWIWGCLTFTRTFRLSAISLKFRLLQFGKLRSSFIYHKMRLSSINNQMRSSSIWNKFRSSFIFRIDGLR